MAGRQRYAHGAARAGILDHAHRNGFRIGGGIRANLSGLANRRRLAGGNGVWRGVARPTESKRYAFGLARRREWVCAERSFVALRRALLATRACRPSRDSATVRWEEFHGCFARTARYSGLPAGQNSGEVDERPARPEVPVVPSRLSDSRGYSCDADRRSPH